jgi:hypothetical protein
MPCRGNGDGIRSFPHITGPLEGKMRGLLAQLSPHEETTLRRVALGFGDAAPSMHIKQLEKLALIERRRSSGG